MSEKKFEIKFGDGGIPMRSVYTPQFAAEIKDLFPDCEALHNAVDTNNIFEVGEFLSYTISHNPESCLQSPDREHGMERLQRLFDAYQSGSCYADESFRQWATAK